MVRSSGVRRRAEIFAFVLTFVVLVPGLRPAAAIAQQSGHAAPDCRAAGPLVRIPELPEASGIAASRRVPGRFWTHNDSGEPTLLALDARGSVTGRVTVSGARVEDWEAVATGPCPAGSCIYIADIGDNDAERPHISIYRIAEPADRVESSLTSDVFHATYPDGPHDAEALLIAPDGRLIVVTKGDTGPIAVYAFPRELRPGKTVRLERIGRPLESGGPRSDDRITDGSVSPDGQWVVLRTTRALTIYPAEQLLAGNWGQGRRVELKDLAEPQGEGVAFGADHNMYVVGEGGRKSQPGTFARLTCTPGR